MASTEQAIDARGTLQNMLNEGCSERASVCEKIDNALDAKATHMNIHIDTKEKTITFADNGHGMDADMAKLAHCINRRKEKSKSKHGRFGRGGAQGTIVLTNLESTSSCLSKCETSPKTLQGDKAASASLIETTIDWKKCVDENRYYPTPHPASIDGLELWKKYSLDPLKTGSVFHLTCHAKRLNVLVAQTLHKSIPASLRYYLARTYSRFLSSGFKLTLSIDGTAYPIEPVHPLYPKYKVTKHRAKKDVHVYKSKTSGKLRAYYNEKETMGYRNFEASVKGKRVSEPLPGKTSVHWEFVGKLTLESVWVPKTKLVDMLEPFVKQFESPLLPNGDWIQTVRTHLYGAFYERNEKIVSRKDLLKNNGTTSEYTYYEDVCHLISFDADLDEYFDVQVNKSRLDEGNFDPEISKTLEYLQVDFSNSIKRMETQMEPTTPPESPKPPVVPKPVPEPVKPAPTPAKPTPEPVKPALKPVLEPVKPTLKPAQEPIAVPVTKVVSVHQPTPVSTPTPTQTTSTIRVESHERHVPKSELDVMNLARRFAVRLAQMSDDEWDAKEFQTTPGQPHTGHYKMLEELLKAIA